MLHTHQCDDWTRMTMVTMSMADRFKVCSVVNPSRSQQLPGALLASGQCLTLPRQEGWRRCRQRLAWPFQLSPLQRKSIKPGFQSDVPKLKLLSSSFAIHLLDRDH